MTFSKRLKIAMDEGGFTQGSLANAVNMAQSSVWKLISANASGSRRVVDIARVLNVRPEWLANGVGPMREGSSNKDEPCENKTAIVKYSGMFPVDIHDDKGPTGNKIMVPDLVESQTCKAYRLKVNSGCTEAPAGTIIVVDSNEQAGTDDLVYAYVNGVPSVYRFVQGGNNGYLSVDDPRVPLIDIGFNSEIIGVVVYILRNMKRR